MHRVFRLLLAVAVLWCGLHLSPAEADGGVWTSADATAHVGSPDHRPDGHDKTDIVHGCHNHCPVAPEIAPGPTISVPGTGQALLFASAVRPLTPSAQAPPLEPPAA